MKIDIQTIPHAEQRYVTVGDWFYEGDTLKIRVSKMSNPRYEFLVAVHELVEVKLCEWAGVSQAAVDEFDMAYERNRPAGDTSEPGDNPDAPYRLQHCIATGVERILAGLLGVDWTEYEREINSL